MLLVILDVHGPAIHVCHEIDAATVRLGDGCRDLSGRRSTMCSPPLPTLTVPASARCGMSLPSFRVLRLAMRLASCIELASSLRWRSLQSSFERSGIAHAPSAFAYRQLWVGEILRSGFRSDARASFGIPTGRIVRDCPEVVHPNTSLDAQLFSNSRMRMLSTGRARWRPRRSAGGRGLPTGARMAMLSVAPRLMRIATDIRPSPRRQERPRPCPVVAGSRSARSGSATIATVCPDLR